MRTLDQGVAQEEIKLGFAWTPRVRGWGLNALWVRTSGGGHTH